MPATTGVPADRGRTTALHAAAAVGDAVKLQRALDDAGQSISAGDKRQYTAFHIACAGGHAACARLLLDAQCDPTLLNDAGLTAWQLAKSLHRTEVLALQRSVPGRAKAREPRQSAVGKKQKQQRTEPAGQRADAMGSQADASRTVLL